jgi:hypothetical protein
MAKMMVAQLENHVINKIQRSQLIHIPTDTDMDNNFCGSVKQTNEDTLLIHWSVMK